MNKRSVALLVLVGIAVVRCASQAQTAQMLDSRLGEMTYEEAIQRFGPPTQCADAGRTRTCTWVQGRGGTVLMPVGNTLMAMPTSAPVATLTFVDGVLWQWQLRGNWK